MAYELEHDGETYLAEPDAGFWIDARLLEIAGEQFQAFNYEARSFQWPDWSGWSQEKLEQYFIDFELPPEHSAKYSALRSLVEARDIDAVLGFIADNGGTQVESFWFIAYWQIILATVATTPTAIALRKRIPWTAPEKITVTLTVREIELMIKAALETCNMCSNEQIKNLGKAGKERDSQYFKRLRAEHWSLQGKLTTYLPQPSSEASAT